jgi:hypothetical protein
MSKQPKKSAKNTETQDEGINESWFLPDNESLQKQQEEHNRLFNQERTIAAVASWMEENLPDPVQMAPEQEWDENDPNRPETEEDWKRAGAIRHLKVRHQAKGRQDQTQE